MRLAAAPGNVRIARRVSRLPHDSVVNVSQLITMDKSFLTEKVSRLPADYCAKSKRVSNWSWLYSNGHARNGDLTLAGTGWRWLV